ncbi:hypothetical protein GSI_06584 [Ganoderma sinense ZZ0214-1]|uniref:Uncharacterized protein n=1 Tax=Ganoderma sinense ZZ0214-1 TaxID=1077348 RepID=A0A2G8SDN2_9APHY|nr:hypothetical protein GSI_06584 [Ganoderma sinense ZZ0214-1]
MSDPRFARLKTDPRFRRINKDKNKVLVDDRFQHFFDDSRNKKNKKGNARVDKYGRPLADDHEQDNLRRFYRLEDEDEAHLELKPGPDYARGEVLLESSDEEDDRQPGAHTDEESDSSGIITLGRDVNQPIPVPDDAEVNLDEDTFADLDAQAAAYAQANPVTDQDSQVQHTRRIAVVNLDWDHVRARHLYKIFASLVSPTGAPVASGSKNNGSSKKSSGSVARGKVLSVRVYPSEFGKERMAREEKEGPPSGIFKKKCDLAPEEINERTVYEVGEGEDYDENALRKYQLERLRYYYAIVECDTVEAASHVFSELEGTELERSANILNLSFVPDGMTFDDDFRDEAKDDLSAPYKPLEFVTDALRHSKVKLTWDEDDPDRAQVTRRVLSRKEIEENDFRAYVASSSSEESDAEAASRDKRKTKTKAAEREKLRALLLGGGDDAMPEGWGTGTGKDEGNVGMEITFTPGLSAGTGGKDETTLEKYQRKMKDKKKKRKEDVLGRRQERDKERVEGNSAKNDLDDDFFGGDSDEESAHEVKVEAQRGKKGTHKDKKGKGKGKGDGEEDDPGRVESTAEELALLAASDNPNGEVKHFDMKAVLRAEKRGGKKKGKKGRKSADDGENELQEDFVIDVKDDRFKAVMEDHTFAIDPTNPHFKSSKGMAALLDERTRRQHEQTSKNRESTVVKGANADTSQPSLQSLVESVKRKSVAMEASGMGKRRKIS